MNENIFYVYGYLRSKDSITGKSGTFYYFGKGKGKRAYAKHRKLPVPKDKSNIIFIAENLSEEGAHQLEIELIKEYGRVDLGTGILRNLTDGGEGNSGRVFSDEHVKNISKSMKGDKHPNYGKFGEGISMYGKKHTDSTIKQMSDVKQGEKNPFFGKKHTEENNRRQSLRMTGDKHPNYGKKQNQLTCPHCNKTGGANVMPRWHFDNCRFASLGIFQTNDLLFNK